MVTELETAPAFTTADAERLVQSLDASNGIPVDAIRQCQKHRDLVIPYLIQAIEQTNEHVRAGGKMQSDAAWLSFYLLWEFQAKDALPSILAAVPGEAGYKIFGDGRTQDLPRALATLAHDNLQVIDEYIANRAHDPYSRSAAATSYEYLVRDDVLTREQAVDRLAAHLRNEQEYADDFAGLLVCTLCDLNAIEAQEDIRAAFERGVIDDFIVGPDDVARDFAGGEHRFASHQAALSPTFLNDTVELLQTWDCFKPKEQRDREFRKLIERAHQRLAPQPIEDDHQKYSVSTSTIRNEGPRVGRNDPCPCGSGKKYKKCCMRENPL